MDVNVEELRLALKVTEQAAAEGRWNQKDWLARTDCGTAGCFAGSYALHCGMQPRWASYYSGTRAITVVDPEGVERAIAGWAGERLGLDLAQREDLFDCGNTLDDLRRIVEDLCGEPHDGR